MGGENGLGKNVLDIWRPGMKPCPQFGNQLTPSRIVVKVVICLEASQCGHKSDCKEKTMATDWKHKANQSQMAFDYQCELCVCFGGKEGGFQSLQSKRLCPVLAQGTCAPAQPHFIVHILTERKQNCNFGNVCGPPKTLVVVASSEGTRPEMDSKLTFKDIHSQWPCGIAQLKFVEFSDIGYMYQCEAWKPLSSLQCFDRTTSNMLATTLNC